MELKEYFGMNPALYSDEDLLVFRDKLLGTYDFYQKEWAEELAEIANDESFDQYSFKGKRQINKLTNKYADIMSDVEVILEVVQGELDKRDHYNEQQRYLADGNYKKEEISEAEFLKREYEKTQRIRRIIADDKDNR